METVRAAWPGVRDPVAQGRDGVAIPAWGQELWGLRAGPEHVSARWVWGPGAKVQGIRPGMRGTVGIKGARLGRPRPRHRDSRPEG